MNRGFVPGANGLPLLEPKQLEMIVETIRPQIEQVATTIAKQECAKVRRVFQRPAVMRCCGFLDHRARSPFVFKQSMRKMLATTVESSNKQLASALGEIAAIKKAVQMLSATTFKNRVSRCFCSAGARCAHNALS